MVVRKLLSLVYLVFSCFKWILSRLWWRQTSSRIGELPLIMPREQQTVQCASQESRSPSSTWSSWDDQSFGVQSKIEEYRRRKEEESASRGDQPPSGSGANADYFDEMQPRFKAAKTIILDPTCQGRSSATGADRNLFDVKDDITVGPNSVELGELEIDAVDSPLGWDSGRGAAAATNWDQDDDHLDKVVSDMEREQRRREREERHRQRLSEHERRTQDKRAKTHK